MELDLIGKNSWNRIIAITFTLFLSLSVQKDNLVKFKTQDSESRHTLFSGTFPFRANMGMPLSPHGKGGGEILNWLKWNNQSAEALLPKPESTEHVGTDQ